MIGPGAMRFDMPGRRRRAVLSLAPLIDVIFILLIFFMLVTQFERFAPVDVTLGSAQKLPAFRTAEEVGAGQRLSLYIKADNGIQLEEHGIISLEKLPAVLDRETESSNGSSLVIAITAEPEVPLQLVLDVLTVVQKQPSMKTLIAVPKTKQETAE